MLDAGHVVPTFVIGAHFVVGADGRHSTVREKSGIAIATLRGHRARTLRNTALKMASQIPLVPRTLATELAGLRYR